MFCRAAWQRFAPLTRKTLAPLSNPVAVIPKRLMSFGIPVTGTNIAYVLLGGGSLTAAIVYAYKTIISDSERYNERIAQMEARPKSETEAGVAVLEMAAILQPASELAITEEATEAKPIAEVRVEEPITNAVEAKETSAETLEAVSLEAVSLEAVSLEAVSLESVTEEAPSMVEAVAAEEPPEEAPAEDVSPLVETTVSMSDVLSTVKILAGSTVEIAAASIGDQHVVAAVKLAEENNYVETVSELELKSEVLSDETLISEHTEKHEVALGTSHSEDLKAEDERDEELLNQTQEEVQTEVNCCIETGCPGKCLSEAPDESVTGDDNIIDLEEPLMTEMMQPDDDAMPETVEDTEGSQEVEKVEATSCEENDGYKEIVDVTVYEDLEKKEEQLNCTEEEEISLSETVSDPDMETTSTQVKEEAEETRNTSMTMPHA